MQNSRMLCAVALAVMATLGAGCSGGLTAEEQERLVGSYRLPQDGIANDNHYVGPFCCTGRTLIVRESQGESVLGYAYFLSWDGQAYNHPEGSIAPDFGIELSARSTPDAGDGEEEKGRVAFTSKDFEVGASKRQRVGALEYIVTIEKVKTLKFEGALYFLMDSLEVSVDVLRGPD
ncbi:hypothetical protein [Hyalangium gracile]|uniref:hypothetical protein n=1 Tax=Hyalangium gracile TaxID=394092 RepID=UPI001CCAC16D|nr:hypothetical protein [Hyalangium gracile]